MLRPAIFEATGPLFFDRIFHDFMGDGFSKLDNINTDVIDQGDNYLLQAELPGFSKEDIKINIDKDRLTILANHREEKKERNNKYVRQERRTNSYSRSFLIPKIKKDDISAIYKNGLLEIILPKDNVIKEEAKEIEIK